MNAQIVLITGAASGIGKELATTLIRKGYTVYLTDIHYNMLDEIFTPLRILSPGNIHLHRLDVRDKGAWEDLITEIITDYGKIDYLFNIAGYILPGYTRDISIDQIDLHIDINVKGTMFGSKVCAEIMSRQGFGHIINISSLAGVAPVSGITAYSASKFAVRGFSLALAQEMSPYNVAVSVLCPDVVATPMMDLQLNYKEAALTFSGSKVLKTEEVIGQLLYLMKSRKREILYPRSRGILAIFGSLFPGIQQKLVKMLTRKGLRHLNKIKAHKKLHDNNNQEKVKSKEKDSVSEP